MDPNMFEYLSLPPSLPPTLPPQPLLRDAYENNPVLTKEEARETLQKALKVLFYRDCRALSTVSLSEYH